MAATRRAPKPARAAHDNTLQTLRQAVLRLCVCGAAGAACVPGVSSVRIRVLCSVWSGFG